MAEILAWRYTIRADKDLDSILDFTYDNWGEAKAASYNLDIRAAVEMLCRYPEAGHTHPSLKPGIRLWGVGSHLIAYRVRGGTLIVLRLLHHRMRVEKHL